VSLTKGGARRGPRRQHRGRALQELQPPARTWDVHSAGAVAFCAHTGMPPARSRPSSELGSDRHSSIRSGAGLLAEGARRVAFPRRATMRRRRARFGGHIPAVLFSYAGSYCCTHEREPWCAKVVHTKDHIQYSNVREECGIRPYNSKKIRIDPFPYFRLQQLPYPSCSAWRCKAERIIAHTGKNMKHHLTWDCMLAGTDKAGTRMGRQTASRRCQRRYQKSRLDRSRSLNSSRRRSA
jgi:hypothetical protein